MKKHQLLALVGTLALLVNLLVPGMAFGAAPESQSGTATLSCDTVTGGPSVTIAPALTFAFGPTGGAGTMYAQLAPQNAFKDPAGALSEGASQAVGNDYIVVSDGRDPSDVSDCNTGLRVTVAENGTFFRGAKYATTNAEIPLANVWVVSSSSGCTGGSVINNICVKTGALCGQGVNNTPATCTDEGVTDANTAGTAFATLTTFTSSGPNLNLTSARNILQYTQDNELLGSAGVGTSFAVTIPGNTPTDVYTLNLIYTLYNTAT